MKNKDLFKHQLGWHRHNELKKEMQRQLKIEWFIERFTIFSMGMITACVLFLVMFNGK